MPADPPNMMINLTAVIVAVTDDRPRVLVVRHPAGQPDHDSFGLPSGPFDPLHHDGLESGLRRSVEAQTGLDLYYVEQLYTFGNRFRDPVEIKGGPRVVSVAYVALTHEDTVKAPDAEWRDWYSFLPWEDWRSGQPAIITDIIVPTLAEWTGATKTKTTQKQRQERINVTFGAGHSSEMDSTLSLERFELLYEAGIVPEARRDQEAASDKPASQGTFSDALGTPLISDHRRILATALG
ncbi:MAG: NUDIX domain-containing protein, partial [Gammaproteobacteria bacterium]|nr:NUDIX domain-containing protein [Gammaproteobacteria bacterium]